MKMKKSCGFSLLEMVIAMFIIAVVIAFSLALMGDGMRRAVKANQLLTATALAQYEIDRVKNIAFPPTTDDRQGEFIAKQTGKFSTYNSNYEVNVTNNSFKADGSTAAIDDETVIRKIEVKVYKKGSSSPLVSLTTYISRNGAI